MMPNTPSFGLGAGAASAGGALPVAGSAAPAFGVGSGGEVSGTGRNRIPSFLFSGTQTPSAGAGFGGAGHAGSAGGYFNSGNNLGGRGGGSIGGGAMDHLNDTADEMPAKTWPFQSMGDHHHRGSTTAAGIAFNDRLQNDHGGLSASDQPPSADHQQQQQRHQQGAGVSFGIDSLQLAPPSALRTTPGRLPPSKSMMDSGPPSVVQLRQPSTPGSFARATPRTSSGYSPAGGMLTTPGAGGAGDSPLTGANASKWITVFGFAGDMESQALREFRRHGDIVRTVPGKGNWMHILYRTPLQAQVALYRPWRILSGSDVMVGAVPCTEPDVAKDEDTAVERGFLVASPSTHMHHHQSHATPGGANNRSTSTSPHQLSPNTPGMHPRSPASHGLRTPSDMIRRSAGYRTDASQPMIQTPQKQTGFLDYISGLYK